MKRGIWVNNDNTMSNMLTLAKLFAPTTTPSKKSTSGDNSWPMFPLDAQIHTEPLRVCKSLIPYLPFEKQKSVSVFIKFYELMSVINYFSTVNEWDYPTANYRENDKWQIDMLNSMKNSLDPANAYWVDIIFKLKDVKNILASAQSPAPPKETSPIGVSDEFTQNISPMLDDSQKQLLETLSAFMK